MTSGGRERRTNWESVTLIRIYLNITWTQQGLRIGYFDFSQVHSRRYFSKFPRYTAGFIFRIFPGTQQAIFLHSRPIEIACLYDWRSQKSYTGKSLAPHSRRYPKMIWGLERCLRGVVGG